MNGIYLKQCGLADLHPKHLWVMGRQSYSCMGVPKPEPVMMTQAEHDLVIKLGECASIFCQKIMPPKDSHAADADEFVALIHSLQARVLSNCAARCYPEKYRLQGSQSVSHS